MNIQAEKIELMKLLLQTENPSIIESIKQVFTNSKKADFWDSLPQNQKDDILLGNNEVDKGEIVDYEDFMSKHR